MPVPANLESERLVIESEIEDYYREKSGFVTDEFRRLDTPMEWNFFFTACLDGIPEITCDKVLFGEKEGTPLNKYFIVSSEANCLPGGWDAPGMLYKYGENIPTGFDEYFTGNPWLLESYAFKLVSTPPEWYREMTFRISIPVRMEHSREFIISRHLGNNNALKITNKTFSSECRLTFKWR